VKIFPETKPLWKFSPNGHHWGKIMSHHKILVHFQAKKTRENDGGPIPGTDSHTP
jgi:hypothetical protein